MDIQALTDNFALPGMLAFDETDAGLIRARITTPACTAEVYFQGAHLALWQPVGHGPVLFLSELSNFLPGQAIRGGVPIVFPWFANRSPSPDNPRTDGPSHGFARTEPWELVFSALSGDDIHLTFTLAPTVQARALGFDNFRLAYHLILGETLTLRLTVANDAPAPLHFEEALHTYLAVGAAGKILIDGLADTEYLDKTDGFRRKLQIDPTIVLTGETDRPYLNTASTVMLEDPILLRRIVVAKQGSQTTVIWNPWTELSAKLTDMADGGWRQMTCIETANAADNALDLAPGSTHTLEARISVEAL